MRMMSPAAFRVLTGKAQKWIAEPMQSWRRTVRNREKLQPGMTDPPAAACCRGDGLEPLFGPHQRREALWMQAKNRVWIPTNLSN